VLLTDLEEINRLLRLSAADIAMAVKNAPYFRSALPPKKQLTQAAMTENDMHRILNRRILAAGVV
jgi:hypothetical protein